MLNLAGLVVSSGPFVGLMFGGSPMSAEPCCKRTGVTLAERLAGLFEDIFDGWKSVEY